MCMSALSLAQFPMRADVHLKQFCMHKILCKKNYNFRRPEDLEYIGRVRANI